MGWWCFAQRHGAALSVDLSVWVCLSVSQSRLHIVLPCIVNEFELRYLYSVHVTVTLSN